MFDVELANNRLLTVVADAYQPEGPLMTFFTVDSSRTVIDSWSQRVASFRTSDVIAVHRRGAAICPIVDVADASDALVGVGVDDEADVA